MILCCNLVDLLHVYVWALNEIVWSGTVADITNDVEKDFYLWIERGNFYAWNF